MNNSLPLVTLFQAKHLKEIGFNYPTTNYFGGSSSCEFQHTEPLDWNAGSKGHIIRQTIPLALQFIREEKGLYGGKISDIDFIGDCSTHDQASAALLDQLLTMIEK